MIRVMIEQYCKPGKETQLRDILIDLRAMAMRQRGYICGETLREFINPSLFKVISTWSNFEDWRTWQQSQQRLSIDEMIESLTNKKRKLSIFTVDHKK